MGQGGFIQHWHHHHPDTKTLLGCLYLIHLLLSYETCSHKLRDKLQISFPSYNQIHVVQTLSFKMIYHMSLLLPHLESKTYYFLVKFLCFLLIFEMVNEPHLLYFPGDLSLILWEQVSYPFSTKQGKCQWRSQYRGKGAECPPWQWKKMSKIRKKREKIGKKRGKIKKNQGKEEKSGRKGQNREGSFTLPLLTDRAGYATGKCLTYYHSGTDSTWFTLKCTRYFPLKTDFPKEFWNETCTISVYT